MDIRLNKRIDSIDVLRGAVMIIMALDHVRDYFHFSANTDDPMNFATTTSLLFFTRWITHFCAPIFIFLSGTSIYLQGLRKTKKELSIFLIKRGLWLILLEIVVNSFGWSFNPYYNALFFQVIWAIGISMVIMGLLIYLPYFVILIIGLLIFAGHNLLDIPEADPNFKAGFIWNLLHHGVFVPYEIIPHHSMIIVYPFLPWTGVMILGYCLGRLYEPKVTQEVRKKDLLLKGFALIALFVVLRTFNIYGNPEPWSAQKNTLFTFFSFIDVHKYPPSLLYVCMTIGPALIALAFIENIKNRISNFMRIFGRVALFYYILHIYLIHGLCMLLFFLRGHTMAEAINPGAHFPWYFVRSGEGFELPIVYIIWVLVIAILYPLCKWYDTYKTNHKQNKWLSYL